MRWIIDIARIAVSMPFIGLGLGFTYLGALIAGKALDRDDTAPAPEPAIVFDTDKQRFIRTR